MPVLRRDRRVQSGEGRGIRAHRERWHELGAVRHAGLREEYRADLEDREIGEPACDVAVCDPQHRRDEAAAQERRLSV